MTRSERKIDDVKIRALFREMRQTDEATAPSFQEVWKKAQEEYFGERLALRERFQTMRQQDELAAPSFRNLWHKALEERSKEKRSFWFILFSPRFALATAAAAVFVAFLSYSLFVKNRGAELNPATLAALGNTRMPTDVLLVAHNDMRISTNVLLDTPVSKTLRSTNLNTGILDSMSFQ